MKLLLAALSALLFAASVLGADPSLLSDPCASKYVNYNTMPISNATPNTQLLGFKRAVLAEDNNPPVCVDVLNVKNKKVEILIETDGDRRICVRDVRNKVVGSTPPMVDQCGTRRVRACFPAETNRENLNLRFYCDQDCETSDVTFYFKINISSVKWDDNQDDAVKNLEMWCMMQDSEVRYPGDDDVPFGPENYVYTSPRELQNAASLSSPLHAAGALALGALVAWAAAF